MYKKLLIANRGEIACRIARTARRMGIAVATVHSSTDAQALHVQEIGESVLIGGGPARESYLQGEAVIAAARRVGADAVHPGFGFLSENPAFARQCADAGLAFIGPAPETLALFGDKSEAKKLAARLGIRTIAGTETASDDIDALVAATAALPTPFVLKAVAGGGGKGMRIVRDRADCRTLAQAAVREGLSSFGDGRLIAEAYLEQPRHIEVQILGDGAGEVVHLFDRECSMQRRHQKIIEEAPASGIAPALREQILQDAMALARSVKYLGLGTVEFAVTGAGAFFLEVNPRLQVEHTVTEGITGLDLVELQIRTVYSRRLALQQHEVPAPRGVAIQARLCAEDPAQDFMPSTGRITRFEAAPGVRTDAGVASGCEISPYYDPMIAKIIAHGPTRAQALGALRLALEQTCAMGVTTNRRFLMDLLADDAVQANTVHTQWIDGWLARNPPPAERPERVAIAMAHWLGRQLQAGQGGTAGAWADPQLRAWRLHKGVAAPIAPATYRARSTQGAWTIGFDALAGGDGLSVSVDGTPYPVTGLAPQSGPLHRATVHGHAFSLAFEASDRHVSAVIDGDALELDILPLHDESALGAQVSSGQVHSPMMGLVIGVHVQRGQAVDAGERLATLESMKMEIGIVSPVRGHVAVMACAERTQVERHQLLFQITPSP